MIKKFSCLSLWERWHAARRDGEGKIKNKLIVSFKAGIISNVLTSQSASLTAPLKRGANPILTLATR